MGIEVVLQDERCRALSDIVHDPHGLVALSLPALDDDSFICLRFVDPYEDTIFNRLQAAVMIEEWDRLEQPFIVRNASVLWTAIRELIVRCSEEPHTYLRFIGD